MDPYLIYIGALAIILLAAGEYALYRERHPKK